MSKLFDSIEVRDEIRRFVDNSVEVADQIHAILERQRKTQRDLAKLLDKNESEVSKWLTGMHNFTLKSISKIEAVLGEKIIATPITAQQEFMLMLDRATKVWQSRNSLYHKVPVKVQHTKYLVVTRYGNLHVTEEKSVSLVA
jgi:transcriptional regulator with XRE-family HTH domain